MNRHAALSIRIRQQKWVHATTVLCGTLLVTSGCGIPCHRHALPGPSMPQYYNWNNGAEFARPSLPPEPIDSSGYNELPTPDGTDAGVAPVPDNDGAQSSDSEHPNRFVSFIKSVSFRKQDEPQAPATQADAIAPPATGGGGASAPMPELMRVPPDEDRQVTDSSGMDLDTMSMDNSAQLPLSAFFDDPYLIDLVNQALVGNQELRILAEEIQIANNEVYARSGEYRPFLTLGGAAGIEKPGQHTRAGAVEEQLEVAPGKGFPEPLPDFLVASDIRWELDIWRKLRNAQNVAALRYLATAEGRNYVVTRLVAEIAESYYELLALDNRLLALERTIQIQQQSLQVALAKKAAGRGTELAVQRFQAEVQKNEAERSVIAQDIVEVENRINFLAGRYPQHVDRSTVDYADLNLNTLSAGVPSQLLLNRADIRQAERQVAAAGLNVQVARANFYPSLTLNGAVGWNAFNTGYLFRSPESLIYGVAGELVGPLINKRAIQAEYRTANAEQLQSIYNYQKTVLEAHIEVVNQISKVENLRRSIEVKKQQLDSLQASVDAANQLFQNARAEYVEVLLAQRELMEAKIHLIEIKQQQLRAVVNAYQALGGGAY